MKRLSRMVGLFFVFILLFVFLVSPSVLAAEDSWVEKESMLYLRRDFGVAVVDGKIFAIGGKYNDTWVGRNEMYDPETDTWTIRSSMPTARSDFAIA
ncbi:MAG: kelch motif-containing protein, partial [Candidatus Bathyarchaeota archaeon]|nr:kelch motif-containing protein [Candidatus Bathyarchaeota archaeon]